jgi:hypothetical protein
MIPWLYAMVRYRDSLEAPPSHDEVHKPDPFDVYLLDHDILESFSALPLDISPDRLPLPAEECYQLVKRCIKAVRSAEFYSPPPSGVAKVVPVESAPWFLQLQAEEQERERRKGPSSP